MTDILIPLGTGSRHQDFELRMCLRSIEKHLKGVGNVFLVGEKPDWVKNVIHIPAKDNPNNWNRARNIYDKIMAGINYIDKTWIENYGFDGTKLSDNFLFMNDDHYLLTDYEAREFPYYHRGEINLGNFKSNPPQYKQMGNTIESLNIFNCSQLDFDIHCPIIYNKSEFVKVFEKSIPKWPEHGVGIKSIYANLTLPYISFKNLIRMEDLKFSEPLMKESIYMALEGRNWFSIGDRCLKSGAMKEVLQELYPNKSKYER